MTAIYCLIAAVGLEAIALIFLCIAYCNLKDECNYKSSIDDLRRADELSRFYAKQSKVLHELDDIIQKAYEDTL